MVVNRAMKAEKKKKKQENGVVAPKISLQHQQAFHGSVGNQEITALASLPLPKPEIEETHPQAFKILPPKFTTQIKLKRPLNEIFPKPPWGAIGVNGPTGVGKSNSIANVLTRVCGYGPMGDDGKEYPRILDSVWVVSRTAQSDPAWKPFLDLKWMVFIPQYTDAFLLALMASQDACPQEERQMIGVVFDDPFADPHFLTSKLAMSFASFCRHFMILPIYMSQKFKAFPPVIRTNIHAYMIFDEGNYGEMLKFFEEYDNFFGGRDNFEAMVRFSVAQRYSFMWMLPQRKEAFLRFEYRLWPLPEGVPYELMPWYGYVENIQKEKILANRTTRRKRNFDDVDYGSTDPRYPHLDDQKHPPVRHAPYQKKKRSQHLMFEARPTPYEQLYNNRRKLPRTAPD